MPTNAENIAGSSTSSLIATLKLVEQWAREAGRVHLQPLFRKSPTFQVSQLNINNGLNQAERHNNNGLLVITPIENHGLLF